MHYVFDKAGNLNYRTNNALVENFQVNNLNELTANTNGGRLTVMGTSTSPATNVSVNTSNALVYGDATFAATNMPLTNSYTAIAQDSYGRRATNTVTVNIATNSTFQYDGNGNLTSDGLRSFAYDDENQLVQVLVTNQWKSQFTYDGKMRRRIRQEFTWQNSAWVETNAVYYVYDGNVVIQERDINNLPTTTYTRGLDLSGSLQGAGGIGGLLARTSQAYGAAPLGGQAYYHSDGNGNVTVLINDSQAVVAKYLYDAFGNVLSKSGLLADANLYRFSSKEAHANSGLVYYLYRYYDPNLQRWLNRDPIGEPAFELLRNSRLRITWSFLQPPERFEGPNVYLFARNSSLTYIDPLGLAYGNPVSGPTGPIAPSDPYAPGGAYYCPPSDPCSGPPGGKAGPQDNICTVPGGSTLAGLEGDSGVTKCCHEHDDCYAANGCNSQSWLPGCGSPACKQCNARVVGCIAGVLFGPILGGGPDGGSGDGFGGGGGSGGGPTGGGFVGGGGGSGGGGAGSTF